MFGFRLRKSWERTRRLLADAVALLPPGHGVALSQYQEYLDHNELELAMDELDAIGDSAAASSAFFAALALAASNMHLDKRHAQLLGKARASPPN